MDEQIDTLVKSAINDQLSEYLHKAYTAGIKSGQEHAKPSEKTMEIFSKIDKKLALLTQKVENGLYNIENQLAITSKQISNLEKRVEDKIETLEIRIRALEDLRTKIAALVMIISIFVATLYDLIKDKFFN